MSKDVITANLPSKYWNFKIAIHQDKNKKDHVVLFKWDFDKWKIKESVLVRIHSECITWDLFWSLRCDCGEQMCKSLQLIEKKWSGIFIYLRQEWRWIWLSNKLKAYNLQDTWCDTIEANEQLWFPSDMRDFRIAWKILAKFWVFNIELISNNPSKIESLKKEWIKVTKIISLKSTINQHNKKYLETKIEKMWHCIVTE